MPDENDGQRALAKFENPGSEDQCAECPTKDTETVKACLDALVALEAWFDEMMKEHPDPHRVGQLERIMLSAVHRRRNVEAARLLREPEK